MRLADGLVIAAKELRELLRDRRALFFAFVLPLLLYPALFFGLGKVQSLGRKAAEAEPSRVGVAGEDPGLLARLQSDPDLEVVSATPDWGPVAEEELDALVVALPPLPGPGGGVSGPGGRPGVVVHFLGGRPPSEEARSRLEAALEEHRDDLIASRFEARGERVHPSRLLPVYLRDLASPEEASGAALGRLLPFILVALLLTGGAFAAIDLIAGEKERGTLETLFVQPVAGGSVVLGKFVAVLAASLAAVMLNLAGMGLAVLLDLGPQADGPASFGLPAPSAVAAALLLIAPLAVLTSAVLLAVSTHARSFRQAQIYLFPLTLVAMLPALLAALPDVRLSPAVAVVPIAGTALSIREALLGEYRWPSLIAAFASTAVYAALALRWAARLLAREDLRLGFDSEPFWAATGAARARRGLAFAAAMLLLVYYGGSAAQDPDGRLGVWGGLALTLWVVVLLPPLLYLWIFRLPLRETLALRLPRARDALLAAALVPPAAVVVAAYMSFQDSILPFPEGLRETMEKLFAAESLHPALAVFLVAVSPAVCEEVLWRGAVQGELEAEGRPLNTALWVGLLFGAFHLSAYRLVPTAFLGLLLAHLRLTSRSILPCMLFHALYNAAMFLGVRALGEQFLAWAVSPWAVAPAAVLLAVLGRCLWVWRRVEAPGGGDGH